jgi:hypothetical protein
LDDWTKGGDRGFNYVTQQDAQYRQNCHHTQGEAHRGPPWIDFAVRQQCVVPARIASSDLTVARAKILTARDARQHTFSGEARRASWSL